MRQNAAGLRYAVDWAARHTCPLSSDVSPGLSTNAAAVRNCTASAVMAPADTVPDTSHADKDSGSGSGKASQAQLWVMGHSLGAAVAQLTAQYLHQTYHGAEVNLSGEPCQEAYTLLTKIHTNLYCAHAHDTPGCWQQVVHSSSAMVT